MGILSKVLSTVSGNNDMKVSEQLLFDKVIGVRGLVPGCGTSLVVQNLAASLSETTKLDICVLDTNLMYPIQYGLLGAVKPKNRVLDIFDFNGDLSSTVLPTSLQNVYLVQLENRTIIDMLSGKDTESCIMTLMGSLKSYFDIVIVDLGYEPTNVAIFSAIKCNKILTVADTSYKCITNIKKSLNTLATMGVPPAKCKNVVLNKALVGVDIGADKALEEAGLTLLGTIPLSSEIALFAASGKKIYGALSNNRDITTFNSVISRVQKELVDKTPLSIDYMDVKKELQRLEDERELEKQEEEVEYMIEESDEEDEEMTEQVGYKGSESDAFAKLEKGANK